MKLPPDSQIARSKFTEYLLVPLARADKSKYLASAGYTCENAQQLIQDIQSQILPLEAVISSTNEFGVLFEIRGELVGPTGRRITVKTIWIREHLSGKTRFVTLIPDRTK